MDLGTVRSHLSRAHFNHYQSVEEFVADIHLVFTNCDTFNPVSCCDIFVVCFLVLESNGLCFNVNCEDRLEG